MLRSPRWSLAVLALCVTLTSTLTASEHSPGDRVFKDRGWQCGHLTRVMKELLRGDPGRGPGDPQPETADTDVLHTKIDIEVDPTARTIDGRVTITANSQIAGLSEFIVYLDRNGGQFTVSQIGGAVSGPSSFTHVGDKVTLTLDGTYNVGAEFTVWLDYGGTPRTNNGIYWGDHFNGVQWVDIVASLSEPWGARTWWVGKDVLDDKCTFDIWLTVDNGYTAVSNGILQGTDPVIGSKVRYRWEETYPMIPYLASIAIADYQLYATQYNHLGDIMPMQFYMLPEVNSPTWQGYCDTYVTMTEVFSDTYGQYPFITEKGGMAHTPTLGPFMEHQTIPSMPTFEILWINAHELAHQWFGDNITCQTWGDIWLNEGITSFSEAVWQEFRPGGGPAEYHSHMAGRWPYSTDAKVYVTDVNNEGAIFSSIVYDKGAWVTHMLRHVLGDAVFFQAILDYRAAFGGSSATTEEFTTSISTTAGFDLSFFMDQWVMNPGSPDYEYRWRNVNAGGQDYLFLRLAQTQPTRGYPLMTMPVDIAVTTNSGTTTYVVWCINDADHFAIPTDGPALQVQVDPDDWILTHSLLLSSPVTIEPTCQGDMDEDGKIDGLDIHPFVQALIDAGLWPAAWRKADMNFDGRGDETDLSLFVEALLSGCELP